MKLAIVGVRGMVGSVLYKRMLEEGDFKHFETTFYSSSIKGTSAPEVSSCELFHDSFDVESLIHNDIILTTQGGDYSKAIYPKLRSAGWKGFWVDAASAFRMDESAMIVLDPVNIDHIKNGLTNGMKDFVGGNCTVSLLLLALNGLIKQNAIEWISSMTYQAASGAGAKNMKELLQQMNSLCAQDLSKDILEVDKKVVETFSSKDFPVDNFGYPLAGSLLPWIDTALENGQSREEWKAMAEANKILQTNTPLPIDGTCVRIGAMRSHSQGLTIKLNKNIPLNEIEAMIAEGNEWVRYIPNNKEQTLVGLTPAKVSGTLDIAIGRVRKMNIGDQYLNAFTVGDQLLWGAAEPLRRMLHIILDFIS